MTDSLTLQVNCPHCTLSSYFKYLFEYQSSLNQQNLSSMKKTCKRDGISSTHVDTPQPVVGHEGDCRVLCCIQHTLAAVTCTAYCSRRQAPEDEVGRHREAIPAPADISSPQTYARIGMHRIGGMSVLHLGANARSGSTRCCGIC